MFHPTYFLGACLLFVFGAGLTYEYLRFQDALHVAEQEHASYHKALNDTACARDAQVRAIEWRGQVLDCELARLILLRTPRKSAYILWWNQSAWVALWQRITHNLIIMTILCTVFITSLLWSGMHMLSSMHLNRSMTQTFDKYQQRNQTMLALPAPQRGYFQRPSRVPQKIYVDDDEVD